MKQIERENGITEIFFPENEPDIPLTDEQQKSESIFDALKNEENSFIAVHRQKTDGKSTMEFIGRFPADQYDIAGLMLHVQKMYGGGDYRFMGYSNGKLRANKLISIAMPVIPQQNSPQDSVINQMLSQMQQMQQQLIALAQDKNSGGHSRKEFFEEMMIMKQFFDSGSRSGGMGEIIATINGLKELGLNIGAPEPEKDAGFSDLLEKAIPLFAAAASQPAPVQPPKPTPTPQQQQAHQMSLQIKLGLATLVNAAAKNSDPTNYVGMIIDSINEPDLLAFFNNNNPDKLAPLAKFNPDVRKYPAWFELLGEHIKANLGLPSKVDHLYDDSDEAIVEESDTIPGRDDGNTEL